MEADGQCVEKCAAYWKQENGVKKCANTCEGYVAAEQECVDKCPETSDANSVCVTCASVNTKLPVWSPEKNACVPCAEGRVWDGQTCTACAGETQYYSVDAEGVTTCHAACPSEHPFATGYECGDSCANKTFKRVQIGEQSHNECVDECEHVYTE